jgi:ketosteroid isomerase-like protein
MVRFVEAWEADDAEAIAGLLADDVVFIDDDDVLTGHETVADWLGSRMGATGAFEFVSEHSETNGAYAYQTGDWSLTRGEGAALGEHTAVFERNGEAEWRLAALHLQRDVINAEGSGNNAFATAFGIGLGQPVQDRISERKQGDYFEILISESGVLDVVLEPVPSDQRLGLEAFDDKQQRIAHGAAADGGGRATGSARVEPGRYYVRVGSARDHAQTSDQPYTLTASLDRTDVYEINDSFAQAAEIEIGEPVVGTIRPEDSDHYKLNVSSAGAYRLALDPAPPELEMFVAVFNETQQRIGFERASGGLGSSVFLDADLPAGVVYVRVVPVRKGRESHAPYTLRITRK